jgi:carbon-monoxide dehydrogenase small subunit
MAWWAVAERRQVTVTVNGRHLTGSVDPRTTLADALRDEFGFTSVHLGCEQGACGACTVLLDGDSVRSCLVLAVQADRRAVTTVEGLADPDGRLHPLQEAFRAAHGLQCGFCTPGMLMTAVELLAENPRPSTAEIRAAISGNLCRCTGYQNIVAAISRVSHTSAIDSESGTEQA